MLSLHKRGRTFHADCRVGDLRLRRSLGTHNQDVAFRLIHHIGIALSEGCDSKLWPELRTQLPTATFVTFSELVGVKEKKLPTWNDLHESFSAHMTQRVKIGKLQGSTETRYKGALREFELFLTEQKVTKLRDITKSLVETFKVWRLERIVVKKNSRGAGGLVLIRPFCTLCSRSPSNVKWL